MGLNEEHPLYADHRDDWEQMRDTYKGERQVKSKGLKYLPATGGMHADGMVRLTDEGYIAYNSYRMRARFPDLVKEAVKGLLGVMHRKPPTIEIPSEMKSMLDRATTRGESLEMLLQRINEEQLVTGRLGLLGDFVDSIDAEGNRTDRAEEPYLSLYRGEDVINWDDGGLTATDVENLNLVVLNETSVEREPSGFNWKEIQKFRVLVLGELNELESEGAGAAYQAALFRETTEFDPKSLEAPVYRGSPASEIPFVFVNGLDVVAEPDDPPLLGLSNLTLCIYRGEADYRMSLFKQGQDTLVIIGKTDDQDVRVGADATIVIPNTDGDAKYIGVSSEGLSEQREALKSDYQRGQEMAGQLLDSTSRERESGEALQIRVAVRTATLTQVVKSGAFALETILKKMARWMGLDDEKVQIAPNLDFVDDSMTGEQLTQWMSGKVIGGPIALSTIHEMMRRRGVTEKEFKDEMAEIEKEREEEEARLGTTNPNGPVPNDPRDPGEPGEPDEE